MLFYKKDYQGTKDFIFLQKINEDKLAKFIDFLELFVCLKCYDNATVGDHHSGVFLRWLMMIKGIDIKQLDKWTHDTNHGFLNGFLRAYFIFQLLDTSKLMSNTKAWRLRSNEYKTEDQLIMMSCIFNELKQFSSTFFNCVNVDISQKFIENEKYIKQYGGQDLINHFLKNIKPALEKLFKNRDEIWISHQSEIAFTEDATIYPKDHWNSVDDGFEWKEINKFSVYTGKLYEKCFHHSFHINSNEIVGLTTVSLIKKYGCEIECAPHDTTWGRDHLFVLKKNDLPYEAWIMTYKHQTELNNLSKNAHIINADLFYRIYNTSENIINKIKTCLMMENQ